MALIIKILFQIIATKNIGTAFSLFSTGLCLSKSKVISKEKPKIRRLFWPEKFIRYFVG